MGKNINDIRISNRSLILSRLYFDGAKSRKALSLLTSLTPAAVTGLVRELIDENIVRETKKVLPSGGTGRSEILLEICSDRLFALGIHFSRSKSVRVTLSDLDGRTILFAETEFYGDFEKVKVFIKKKTAAYGDRIIGVGITTHGIVDSRGGISVDSYGIMPKDTNLKEIFSDLFDCPVTVENNVRALLTAYAVKEKNPPDEGTLFIKYGQGVGGAYLENGRGFLGSHFRAAEIGHIVIEKDGEKCVCGKNGCLETKVSYRVIEKKAKEIFHRELTARQVFEMYENGDRAAEKIINPVVEILSISIGNFCTVFDPKRLIIFSDMFYFGRFYVKMVKEINEQRGSAETVFIKDGGELQKFSAASLAVGNFLASGGK